MWIPTETGSFSLVFQDILRSRREVQMVLAGPPWLNRVNRKKDAGEEFT